MIRSTTYRFFQALVVVLVLGTLAYALRAHLSTFAYQALSAVAPCQEPIPYAIGSIDPRFGISQKQLLADVKEAAQIWDGGAGKNLFVYDQKGGILTINLIYDYRQEMSVKLKSLGLTLNDDQSSYNAIKSKYDALTADYQQKKVAFEAALAAFNARQDAYNKEVTYWNDRGGAPKDVYDQLQSEKAQLAQEQAQLQQQESDINAEADSINALVTALNHLIDTLQLEVSKYNTVGASAGNEFEEAVYTSAAGEEAINVYEYDNNARLVRVLAHELGHALGLSHVNDPRAIMYRLNQSSNEALTAADIGELKSVCRLK